MAPGYQPRAWVSLPLPGRYEAIGRNIPREFVHFGGEDVENQQAESNTGNLTRSFSGDVTRTNTFALDSQESLVNEKAGLSQTIDIYDPNRPQLPIRQRLQHFTWAWYTLPMSTGGLSLLIFSQPYQFAGEKSFGLVVYILNIIIFSLITMAMTARFFLHTGELVRSLTHPKEGFYFPTFFLSIATVITSTQRYAISSDHEVSEWAIRVAFWIYITLTALLAIGQYSYIFATHSFSLQDFMPTLILPIFPIMLSGTIASIIAATQPKIDAMPILVAGLTCQGLGLSVAILMYAHMIGRLIQSGLPGRENRPGLFMFAGPPSFTSLALIGMANGVPDSVEGLDIDRNVIKGVAVLIAVFLWAFGFWWFSIAAVAVISSPPKYFHLGWWAMVFPNTGFTLATIYIAKELISPILQWVTIAMTICMILAFFFVFYKNVRAVLVQDIMYPGRDENAEDQ